ncbi:MAG TPA: SDR family oxidoreductase [Pilimelia sp.]|nr:SDR family oxidoreductase [Pilimelia sp.]
MTYDLTGRVVVITGAARGIGEQTARAAAAAGAHVALVGLEPERLAALAGELGPPHAWFECDVTDQAALDRAVEGVTTTFGGIDAVVANAGVVNIGTAAVCPVEAQVRTIDVNLLGVVRTVCATLPQVIERRGYYLLVSSLAAFTVLPGMAAYCASKAGVEQYGNALRLEVAHKGVAVGTAHMTWIDTDLVRDARDDLSSVGQIRSRLPGPLGANLSAGECARAFVRGISRRSRRVFVPRSLAVVELLRPIILGPVGNLVLRRPAARAVPELEDEVRQLGRSFGRNSVALRPD